MQRIVLCYHETENPPFFIIFPTNVEFVHSFIHSLRMNAEFNSSAVTFKSLLWMGRFPHFAQLLLCPQSCLDEESTRSKGLFPRCLFGLVAALIWILSKPCG